MPTSQQLLRRAVELARENVRSVGGRPFGAVLAGPGGEVLQEAVNESVQTGDPTAHAELVALREAGRALGPGALEGATVYASGAPCPMCLAAMHLAGVEEVVYAYTQDDGAPYGLSTKDTYDEVARPEAEREIRMRHEPVRASGSSDSSEPDLYALWQEQTGGA